MKTAIYQNQNIVLEQLSRDQYQKIFLAGKTGQLTCPTCNESVRLFLGIHKEPHFFHTHSPESHCPEPTVILEKVDSQPPSELNGFSIPKGRTITKTPQTIDRYKVSKTIEYSVPFNRTINEKQVELSPFLQQLADNGVVLDQSQAAAVIETEGSLLVLAGAGSGKTRVLTARTAYMLVDKHIDPRTIILVTFTSKGAA
jgi:DNA helicase-2/ATP-dependent DNA helicase PcrA